MSEQVDELRVKLEQVQAEYDSYRKECKQLEEFLEQQSKNKEKEILQLKEQAIMKEKDYKTMKNQLAELEQENSQLKTQVENSTAPASNNQQQKKRIGQLQQTNQSLQTQLQTAQQQLATSKQNVQKITEQQQQIITQKQNLNQQYSKLKEAHDSLDLHCAQLEKQLKNKESPQKKKDDGKKQEWQEEKKQLEKKNQQLKSKLKESKNQASELKKTKEKLEALVQQGPSLARQGSSKREIKMARDPEKDRYQEHIRKLQDALVKNEKTTREYKFKLESIIEQNQILQSRLNHTSLSLTASPTNYRADDDSDGVKINYSCLLITKPHYISPFLQIYQDKGIIKIYKSSRSGCFQKSMGTYKHRFDIIAYQQEQLLQPIANAIQQSQQNNHVVIFYGPTRTSKKILMVNFISHLQSYFQQKINDNSNASALFIQKSSEESKDITLEAKGSEQVLNLIQKLKETIGKEKPSNANNTSPKKSQNKGGSVRYLKLKGTSWQFQIATSSYTNATLRDKMSPATMFNQILYSRLPDVLQSSLAHKHLVLTLNPIVSLYEQTKNTLVSTLCRGKDESAIDRQMTKQESDNMKKDLSQFAKKKFEAYERDNEQTALKVKRLQEDCLFYKSRFQELEFRLKNLLNTHSNQTTYLKKSPAVLSYQKLLKFVHSVQGRNLNNLSASQIINNQANITNQSIVINDNESVQAL